MRKLILFTTLIFLGNLILTKKVFAQTTDYIDPNGDGTIPTADWNTTGTYYYTEIDEATRQPNTPTTSDNIYSTFTTGATAFFRMSTLSNVDSVSQIDVWVYHNDGARGELRVQLYDDDETTTRSSQVVLTQSSTDAWHSATFSGLSLTQTQLDSLTVALTVERNSGGAPNDVYAYAMYALVTYTEAPSVSISLTTDGSVAFGHQALDSTQDSSGDVEIISVDSGPADLDIKSTDFSDGTYTWTLSTSNGYDQVYWEFSQDGSAWSGFDAADTPYIFETNVGVGETRPLYFQLTTPTDTSSYDQFNTTVTVIASAP